MVGDPSLDDRAIAGPCLPAGVAGAIANPRTLDAAIAGTGAATD
jgi:hypothetical protein